MGLIVFAIVCQCLQRSIDAPISIAIYLRPIQRLYMKAAPKLRNRKKMTNYSLKKKMSFARVSSNLSQTRRKILMIFLFLIVVYQFFGFNGNVGTASLRGHFQGSSTLGADHDVWVSPNAQPFNENNLASNANHLIMVAGHSVLISGHLQDAGVDENDWFLYDYQKGQGIPQAMLAHIRGGIKAAAQDEESILIFSGGETRATTGPVNEGTSYFRVADAMNLWEPQGNEKSSSTVRARTTTEEFATDSFQNLLFSICRFKEVTGSYPKKITIVSFSFKKKRFVELHGPALRWPSHALEYIGYDPEESTGFNLERASEGELKSAALPFETDPYGCNSKVLQEKREGRNPFRRRPPYELTCSDMKSLLTWCGPELISEAQVPW